VKKEYIIKLDRAYRKMIKTVHQKDKQTLDRFLHGNT